MQSQVVILDSASSGSQAVVLKARVVSAEWGNKAHESLWKIADEP
jgi:hypothetical protein